MVRLLVAPSGYDFIWVIVDRLTNSAYFLLVKTRYDASNYVASFVKGIVRLYGVLASIVSDRGSQFTSQFL